jgi:RNA polymerase sigma-70 factor (ECF subfamily)
MRSMLREDLNALTPRLRRYARALISGSPVPNETADDLIQATLMRAIGARHVGIASDLVIRLYATVTQLHREIAVSRQTMAAVGAGRPTLVPLPTGPSNGDQQTKLSGALLRLPLEDREAILLVGLEGFSHGEAARILRISRSVLIERLTQARTALDSHLTTRPAPRPAASYLRLVTS